ncbi:hypothetical protein GV794_27815 [Nocardia cyriacigeorgica]|uniref:Uncharacterized protein n=1 Tax=Nocardia cyriacigeorgica TaxID=135487 RepID=A0ABX0CSE6_9NOCA|nr:hypothetical protein [Nocardia cyriacigeorgica]NEW59410.1 hypothetical protein [Nocardia cyriacigeorgica]
MTTYPDAVTSTVEIDFDDWVPEDSRQAVRNSITALAVRHSAENARRRELDAEDRALAEALRQPLLDQVRNDSRSADALRSAVERQRARRIGITELPVSDHIRANVSPSTLDNSHAMLRDFEGWPTRFFHIPYDFSWSWHDLNGGRPRQQILALDTGQAALDSHAGNTQGSDGSVFVAAHAGFGVVLRSDRRFHCMARSLRSSQDFAAASAGLDANATVEGGCEITVMSNGVLKAHAVDKRFRGRVSGTLFDPSEDYNYDSGGFGTGAVIEVRWTMEANTQYELNVGAWTFAEAHQGIGGAGANSQIDAKIIFMSLWQQPA